MKIAQRSVMPVYQVILNQLRQAIIRQEYPPGGRIDSIHEIQKRFGVSRETAKLVLKKLSDERLIVQKPGKGSFVADLGALQPAWAGIVPYFSVQIEQLLTHLDRQAKIALRFIRLFVNDNQWEEEIKLVGALIQERIEAVIVVPTRDETRTAPFYRKLISGETVVTLLDHTMAGSYFTYAIQSYDLGVRRAVGYLLERTGGSLALVKNDMCSGRNMVYELMEETFRECVEEAGRKAWVVERLADLESGAIQKRKVTGILCCDDLDAVRVLGRLKEWRLDVPKDVSLVSYGNTDLARYFTPAITSVDGHAEELVQKTIEIINAHRNREDTRFHQFVIQPTMVIRET
jgi:DNA-binding LacI/PurR family transcriptional regulator